MAAKAATWANPMRASKYQMTHKNDGAGVASGARGADRATITRPSGMRHLAKGLLDGPPANGGQSSWPAGLVSAESGVMTQITC